MANVVLASFFSEISHRAGLILLITIAGGIVVGLLLGLLERRTARHLRARRAEKRRKAAEAAVPSSDLVLEEGPDCPKCHSPMVIRVARRGPKAGSRFWGCSNYPACRSTRALA